MNRALMLGKGRRQSGFVLVLAVFILVMLAAISAYLLTISNLQVQTAAQDELGARAYQSARTGIEWGSYQILRAPAQPFATDRKSTRLNSSHIQKSRMPSSA